MDHMGHKPPVMGHIKNAVLYTLFNIKIVKGFNTTPYIATFCISLKPRY